jgi:ribonuclease-3
MNPIERTLNYQFNNPDLLNRALTHSSYGNEHQVPDYERLEFLGDAILGMIVSRELMQAFPEAREGTLSKLKSVLVSTDVLAEKARMLRVGDYMRFGRGEKRSRGARKTNILADAMEALIGAIYMDRGFEEAEKIVLRLYGDEIRHATLEIKHKSDFKTRLQERLQELGLGLPRYELIQATGPDHNRTFEFRVYVGNYVGPLGNGSSKKAAHQDCAKALLEDDAFWQQVTAPPQA